MVESFYWIYFVIYFYLCNYAFINKPIKYSVIGLWCVTMFVFGSFFMFVFGSVSKLVSELVPPWEAIIMQILQI